MQTARTAGAVPQSSASPASLPRRGLIAACLAHALHDGYTDGLYAFLPIWQAQFGLSYAGLAVVRALYSGTMAGFQTPGARLSKGVSARAALSLCTLAAAAGFIVMALPLGFAGLCLGLVIAGIGSSLQHPRGSLLVTESYPDASRKPLGVYNFSGDLGKAALPALIAVLLPLVAWRSVAALVGILGIAVAIGLLSLAPRRERGAKPARAVENTEGRSGFALLMTIGAFDTATRMGYLLFLPFLIHGRGGNSATIGLALALLFLGGALGKATCGLLADRLGVIGAVAATEAATAFIIVATLFTPLMATLILLPVLGVVLNGTSSALYGTVPELAPRGDTGRGFALFYTAVSGAGGLAPIAYGFLADHTTRTVGVLAAALTAALIVPMVAGLRSSLAPQAG